MSGTKPTLEELTKRVRERIAAAKAKMRAKPSNIDLTPSGICTKLLPDDSTTEVRQVAEAMAEQALRIVHRRGGTYAASFTLWEVEKLMADASGVVRAEHIARCDRLLAAIRDFEDDDDIRDDYEDDDGAP